ncbi:arginine N-succinyltransferase [Roseateles terrae]|uniref:Uncharacterized protein n=1 Tax=Roseateles terrae TaxID=431060 RepID=A0ABR6GW04_9BURK|nr:arginine N-succinyltransferase [Roseateles terrae]MBB3196298.1 hypothetical protein [Roseateles terrae]
MRLERVDSLAAWPSSWRAVMAEWMNQLGEPVVPALPPGHSLRVLLDTAQDRPLACARIVPPLPSDTLPPAQAGAASDALRFHFRVGKLVHVSDELPLYNPQQILLMGNDLCDAIEITDLAVDPQAQEGALKLAHLLKAIVAEQASVVSGAAEGGDAATGAGAGVGTRTSAPSRPLFVELQGYRDAQGRSPFWRGLGGRFLPERGDAPGVGPTWRRDLADLLPALPLYASLMDDESRSCMGRTGPAAAMALEALKGAGFRPSDYVKIDDAGPCWQLAL